MVEANLLEILLDPDPALDHLLKCLASVAEIAQAKARKSCSMSLLNMEVKNKSLGRRLSSRNTGLPLRC